MSEVKIKELDKSLIHQANSNSMSGKRGDISAHEYEVYCQKVMSWNIPDSRKQKIVDQIYAKWSEQLRHEAAHVSVAVAGPARYNAKKLDHSDTILRLSSEFVEWFKGLQEQVWQGRIEDKDAKEIARLVDDIKFCVERPTLNPTASLCELANKDPELFMEYYEKLHEKYRWRKNSVIAKLYAAGKEGKLANLNRQKFFRGREPRRLHDGRPGIHQVRYEASAAAYCCPQEPEMVVEQLRGGMEYLPRQAGQRVGAEHQHPIRRLCLRRKSEDEIVYIGFAALG